MLNRSPLPLVLGLVGAAVLFWLATQPAPAGNAPHDQCPGPNCPDNPPWHPRPRPCPVPGPCPRPRGDLFPAPQGPGRATIAGRAYDGEEISADLPGSEHLKNVGSKKDGAGMCVFSSIEMAALWQGLECMRGWRNWCATNYPGGGYPQKVDQLIQDWCKHKGIPVPEYAQYEGQSPEQILDIIDRTRRMACWTYGYGERYSGTIAHMTCGAKFGGKYAVNLDNNFPGDGSYEWMSRAELLKRIKHPSGKAWVFVWLTPAPPLPPFN